MFSKILKYLFHKRDELEKLGAGDILMGKVVLDIHRYKIKSEFLSVPLYSIRPIHPIDRENAVSEMRKRAGVLEKNREEILRKGMMDREFLNRFIPSISWIKVIREKDTDYIAYEGNGRLEALKRVFTEADGLLVEVELYTVRNPGKILRRIDRVRRKKGVMGMGLNQ